MTVKHIQDILPLVEQPSRYIGSEVNRIRKGPEQIRLRFALAFPDLYEIGTSHFGLQILYDILNRREEIAAERIFVPAPDMEAAIRKADIPISTLETQTPLNRFDIVGFSLLYELDYTNILTLLDLGKIPFLAEDRTAEHPLIIAGGPCTCNPEPVADFFDAMVAGDGEGVIMELTRTWLEWKDRGGVNKTDLLRSWSAIEGVYIPSFFKAEYDSRGRQRLHPVYADYTSVRRAILPNLDTAPFPESPVVPFGKPIHDRLRLEVARGCTRGCRFCQAGMIYRPVRERSPQTLLDQTERAVAATGYEDLSLLSLSTGDYRSISPLMTELMRRCEAEHIAVSLPSLRAGTLTPELMSQIKRVRKTGFTIAPEAGSQRLRNVINKNISEAEILETVQDAFAAGWQVIKLYFMIGLPTETEADLKAIVHLVERIRRMRGSGGKKPRINVSVGTYIPKPHTPFQWRPQISLEASREKIEWLRDRLDLPGVRFKWQEPRVSFLEGVWSRGDRRLSRLLITAYQKGCRLDGWSDRFRFDLWQKAFLETGIDPEFYTARERDSDAPLPWDVIDMGVARKFLWGEWEKALAEENTADCRDGGCEGCGVCDFDRVQPVVFPSAANIPSETAQVVKTGARNSFRRLQVFYSKTGPARYFGHLEMVSIFLRSIRRAKIPVKFSQGFPPMPKVSFTDPIPLGMESREEFFFLTVPGHTRPESVYAGLKDRLPEGLDVHACRIAPPKSGRTPSEETRYRITLRGTEFEPDRLRRFEARPSHVLTQTTAKGRTRTMDLKETVLEVRMDSDRDLHLRLKTIPGKTVRPSEVLREIFGLNEEAVKRASILKL